MSELKIDAMMSSINRPNGWIDGRVDPHVEKHALTFGSLDRLSNIVHFKFFTPALLYLYGRFTDVDIARYNNEINRELVIAHHRFNRPIFNGMTTYDGDSDWNHALWCCPVEDWPGFESYVLSLLQVDRLNLTVYGVGSQDVIIADPLYLDTRVVLTTELPLLSVVVFGVNSNRYCVAVESVNGELPAVRWRSPQLQMQQKARVILLTEDPVVGGESSQLIGDELN